MVGNIALLCWYDLEATEWHTLGQQRRQEIIIENQFLFLISNLRTAVGQFMLKELGRKQKCVFHENVTSFLQKFR
jgi:hypothetical protein